MAEISVSEISESSSNSTKSDKGIYSNVTDNKNDDDDDDTNDNGDTTFPVISYDRFFNNEHSLIPTDVIKKKEPMNVPDRPTFINNAKRWASDSNEISKDPNLSSDDISDVVGENEFDLELYQNKHLRRQEKFPLMEGSKIYSSFPDGKETDPTKHYSIQMTKSCLGLDGQCNEKDVLSCSLSTKNVRRCHWG